MGLNTSSLIGNTSLQQPNLGYYSWLPASQKLPLYNQQFNFTNPFTKNKTLGDWKNYLNNLPQQPQQQQNPLDYLSFLQNGSGALSQAVGQIDSTIQSNSSSPVTKAISSAVTGIGRNVLSSVGQSVGSEVVKQLGTSTLKEGFKNLSTSGLKSAAKSGLGKAFSGASLGGVALSVANQFAPQKREYSGDKGNITKGLDNAYDKLSDAVAFIPGAGTTASLIMKGRALAGKYINKWGGGTDGMTSTDAILGSSFLNLTPLGLGLGLVNGFGGKKTNTFNYNTREDQQDRNYISGSYNMQKLEDAQHQSGKKYGLFSSGARREANSLIGTANNQAHLLREISQKSQFQNTFGNAMQNINTVDYQKKLQGYQPNYMHIGKNGMKIEKQEEEFIIPDISEFKPIIATEEQLQKFKEGGSFNIIPDGALHARKNNMELDGITKKGIPVVDKDGNQQAEIEKNEIIFRKEVTTQIEEAMQDGSDKKAIEIGKLLVKEIFKNTKDNTGLIKEVTKEDTPTLEDQIKEHEVFPKHQNGGNIRSMEELISYANKKNPRFVQRLNETTLRTIPGKDGQVMSHVLGYADADGKTYVFPQVQEIDNNLKYFDDWKEAFDTALKNKNVLEMSPKEAELFTTNYKKYYPSFKQYISKKENGGILNNLDLSKLSTVEKDTLLQLLLQKASL